MEMLVKFILDLRNWEKNIFKTNTFWNFSWNS